MATADKTPQKPFTVTNTQARSIHTCGLTLVPGKETPIPAEYVERLKTSPAWKAKWIVEGAATMPAPQIPAIGKLDVDKAIKLINVETDIATLNVWADTDKRPEILSAIGLRIRDL